MKLVLVAGFNPRVAKVGPRVQLYEGWWKIVSEGVVNSTLTLVHDGVIEPLLAENKFYSKGGSYHLSVTGGSEDFINVFAEVTDGPDPSST
jgi:hypothetical protein